MLKYKIIQQRNALNENSEVMYYPRLTESHKYDLDYVADMISMRSSLTKGDIVFTLVSLEDIIPELLREGGGWNWVNWAPSRCNPMMRLLLKSLG